MWNDLKLNRVFLISVLLLVMIVALLGCGGGSGGGKTPDPAVIIDITGGTNVDVSTINSRNNKYAMITYLDGSEGYNDKILHTPTLTTANVISGSIALQSKTAFKSNSPGVYSDNQTASDSKMRLFECQALASGNRQFSKAAGYDPAVQATIAVGTPWNSVNVQNMSDIWVTINTTCKYVSDHAYFFVDNRNITAMNSYLANYATKFENIYATDHSHFGLENDVDGNGHVIIIFSQELTGGLLGYFDSIDKYPKTTSPTATYQYSNEGDIFYITADAAYQGNIVLGTLAHEFQHMIYFDQHYKQGLGVAPPASSVWLNEALSQAAEYYNNYLDNHLGWIKNYLYCDDYNPSTASWYNVSLTHWTSSNYGAGAIFIRYLIDQYGDDAIKTIDQSSKVGIAAVEEATGQNFDTIFSNFSKALLLSSVSGTTDPLYKFKTLNLKAIQTKGRGGLYVPFTAVPGDSGSVGVYPYNLMVIKGTGNFATMNLSSSGTGWAFGY
jgi:hypothetical protein